MTWQAFEQLAAQIYSELDPRATVTHNDRIRGIESGLDRQIDVSIRFRIAAHDVLSIVQAKDYGQPADINDVGEFATVIEDVRANKGILICRGGFTDGAKKLAANRGIDLCNIHDAQSRDWSLEVKLPILWIDLLPKIQVLMEARFDAGDSISANPEEWVISTDHGRTSVHAISTFVQSWNEGRIPRDTGKVHRLSDPNLLDPEILVSDSAGVTGWRPISDFAIVYTVSSRAWLGSFTPEECRGILKYSDDTFTVSYLPIGEIPMERDERWREIEDLNHLAVTAQSTLITTEGWQIDPASAQYADVFFHKLDLDE
jgi:hypothetical protein